MSNRHIFPALLVTTLLVAPACASQRVFDRYPTPNQRTDGRAYRNGYQSGRIEGENDARRGRRFDYSDSGVYRSANGGYDSNSYGSRNEYRLAFRQGFAAGYDDGYRRNARGDRYSRPPNVYGGREDGGAVYRSPAADSGFRDGYAQGRDDARDGDRYDPVRASRYREGDHDYNSRYGSRDAYKRDYRAAFQQGYERGYREVRR